MLHILWVILKIIGVILAVLVGVLVLLVCIVLFTPVRYQICAKGEHTIDSLEADVRISWFFHLVSGHISVKHRKVDWLLRVAWKKFQDNGTAEDINQEKQETVQETQSIQKEAGTIEKAEAKSNIESEQLEQKDISEDKERVDNSEKSDIKRIEEALQSTEKEEKIPKASVFERIQTFWGRIKQKLKNIKYTMESFCDKIKLLLKNVTEKKEFVLEFLTLDTHQRAFVKIKKEAVRLLSILRPKTLSIRGVFGCADPGLTGQIFAGLSIVLPFLGDMVCITPDFDHTILEGEMLIKGKLRPVHVVYTAIRLLLNKDIRTIIKDIRKIIKKSGGNQDGRK